MPEMSEVELKLTSVLVRELYGWHREELKMTWDEMQEKTGIGGRASIKKAIDAVIIIFVTLITTHD